MKTLLDGRVAIVTGGAKGFGRGIAGRLAREGCRVVAAAMRAARYGRIINVSSITGKEGAPGIAAYAAAKAVGRPRHLLNPPEEGERQ